MKNSLTGKWPKILCIRKALQTTLSVWVDIFYPPNFCDFEENGVFQQPRLITTVHPPMRFLGPDAGTKPGLFERDFPQGERTRRLATLLQALPSKSRYLSCAGGVYAPHVTCSGRLFCLLFWLHLGLGLQQFRRRFHH